ncbi:hypothetical protein BGX28_000158 [Mortierella sp. GBA30]|nr:hypothetical protein BGX28_000158 [Mortierella sp. GBA30]
MTPHNPLEIFSILLEIATFLDKRTILTCSRVCRSWHALFEPFLWHKVTLLRDIDPVLSEPVSFGSKLGFNGSQQQLLRQQQRRYPTAAQIQASSYHIRILRYYGELPFLKQLLPGCRQLRYLEVTCYNEDIKQLLKQNTSTLETFICKSDPLTKGTRDPVVLDIIYRLLEEMPNLRTLELDSVIVSDYEGRTFGRVCQKLARLSLIGSKLIERPKSEDRDFENLTTLILDKSYIPNDRQLETFQLCPAIEQLTWKSRTGVLPIMNFLFFLNSGKFRSVTTLDLSDSKTLDIDLAKVFRHLPRLNTISARNTLFGYEATKVLVEGQRRHQLLELDLLQCTSFTTREAQDLLEKCDQLRLFFAPSVSAVEMGRLRWACHGLEELDVCIAEMEKLPLPTLFPRHGAVYSQLGALSKLRVLRLGDFNSASMSSYGSPNGFITDVGYRHCMLDLKLDSGLDLLSTLTRLRELDCEKMQARMEFVDLQWMVQTWRQLERVVGSVHPNVAQRDLSNEFLQDQLPGLKTFLDRKELWMAET